MRRSTKALREEVNMKNKKRVITISCRAKDLLKEIQKQSKNLKK